MLDGMYNADVSKSTASTSEEQKKAAPTKAEQQRRTATLGRKAALKAYLRTMGKPLNLVAFLPDAPPEKKKIEVCRVTNDEELEAALKRMWSLNGNGWNIYAEANIGNKLNEKGEPARNSEADITHIRCIVGDKDAKDGVTMEQCEAAVDGLPRQPSLTGLTGGGVQPHFALHEPVEATGENRAKARAAGAGLAALLGGDPTFSLEHLFRVPGFKNWPNAKKREAGRVPVTATVREAIGPTYSLDELYEEFGKYAASEDLQGDALPALPAHLTGFSETDNTDLGTTSWNDLTPEEKNTYLAEMLQVPDVIALAGASRKEWLTIVAACARSGAPSAKEKCRGWSKLYKKKYNEADFDRDYESFRKSVGNISIGTLIRRARDGGWIPPWHKAHAAEGEGQAGGDSDEGVLNDAGRVVDEEEDEDHRPLGGNGEDEKAALDLALKSILVDRLDAKSIEDRITKKFPTLASNAHGLVTSAQRIAENWKPGVVRTIGGLQKRIISIDRLNQQFVLIALPGQPICIGQISDAQLLTESDFAKRMADAEIVIRVVSGKPKTMSASKVWLNDNRRRLATKVGFTSRKVGPECFNLWTKFGVEPQAGTCDLIHQHIHEVICAGRDREYEAFLNLLAWQAQNIGRSSRIIVVLYSEEQQIGKGMLLEKILLPMYGALHGFFTNDAEKALGKFNSAITGKAYMAFDEACFSGDRKVADKIKSVAATENTTIEKKGLPVVSLPTAVNIFMATNNAHAAHVEWNDARYWILKVSPHRKEDTDYWDALINEIVSGGVEAFLHSLLSRDLSGFRPQRDVPRENEEHRANKVASDPTHPALWLLECLESNQWLGSEKWEGRYTVDGAMKDFKGAPLIFDTRGACTARLLPAFIYDAYREWAKNQGRYTQPASAGVFWKRLTELNIYAAKGNIGRWRIMPSRASLRISVEQMLGGTADWTA